MSGISHQQAIQWIHRRLDGLLSVSQLLSLEEHLRSCDECSTYASEMELLPLHLRHEFHTRWDKKPGPSQQVIEHVTTKARNIPVANRFSSGIKLLTGAMALILLGVAINFVVSRLQSISPATNATRTVDTSPLPQERLLAFASDQNGNLDIYTMYPDGSGLTNLTNNPAQDSNPIWSPDGKQIAFESDRDGFTQIHLMDTDGSNVLQLTHNEASHFLPMNIHGESNPWSPDGSKLLFLEEEPGSKSWTLNSLDMNSGDTTKLATGHIQFNNISWSPDGKHIGYVLNDSPTPESTFVTGIYVVDPTGSNLIAINQLVPQTDILDSPAYHWSRDGSSIIFTAYRHLDEGKDQWIAYEAVLGSNQLIERATSSTRMEDWWEGTSFIGGNMSTLTWLRSDGTFDTFKPLEACRVTGDGPYGFMAKRSPHGSQIINISCPNAEMWFYYANSDGTIIRPLMSSPIPSFTVDNSVTSMTWSSDDQFIAVTLVAPKKSSMYILNVKDPAAQPKEIVVSSGELYTVPSWRPVTNNEAIKEIPTLESTRVADPPIGMNVSKDEWIAFIEGKYNSPDDPKLDVYLIHPDGSGLINLTNSPAHYFGLQWSPDGQHLLFSRENADKKVDILRHDDGAIGLSLITNIEMGINADFENSWSPNSATIAFVDNRAGNADIYTIDADGQNFAEPQQLTNDPGQDVGFVWSPDGSQIAFQRLNGDQLSVYVMNEDGSNPHEVARGMGKVSLHWSMDGQSLYANSIYLWGNTKYSHLECEGCVAKPAVYRIDLDESSTQQIHYEEDASKVVGWDLYESSQNTLYFMSTEVRDASVGIWGKWFSWDGNSVSEIGSLDPRQACSTGNILSEDISPNKRFSIISNYCAGAFDLYLADREATDPNQRMIHLLRLPSNTAGQGGDFATLPMTWSPNGRWLIYDSGSGSMPIFNIDELLQDPTTQPTVLLPGEGAQDYDVFDLVWQPSP